ncbi:hypothetical protein [Arcanobacterium buesumense]|uniref:HK97 gp10 family phage protein n=1 Tax=Arcanobacterium buesumense TaxID=2722751 RepID=A0A6H2ELR0_9ACTO|nr:hypothetical protein [Arcanobacterium buesumense]QJC22009.1 hypothetical protein HC352_05500 [Arcanobacterium buesumense]
MTVKRIEINEDALFALVRPLVEAETARIAGNAGEGFVGDVIASRGKDARPHGAVRATTYKARLKNLRENTLLKAVGGAQ